MPSASRASRNIPSSTCRKGASGIEIIEISIEIFYITVLYISPPEQASTGLRKLSGRVKGGWLLASGSMLIETGGNGNSIQHPTTATLTDANLARLSILIQDFLCLCLSKKCLDMFGSFWICVGMIGNVSVHHLDVP